MLDWDSAYSGDPRLEFITAAETVDRNGKFPDKFKKGYETVRDFELSEELEKIYRMDSSTSFLSSMQLQKEEDISISDRNLKFHFDTVNQILEEGF